MLAPNSPTSAQGGVAISRKVRPSLATIIRQLLSRKNPLTPAIALTLVRLYKWALSIQRTQRNAVKAKSGGPDIIVDIANRLIGKAAEPDRMLLSKSLQEALLYCVGF